MYSYVSPLACVLPKALPSTLHYFAHRRPQWMFEWMNDTYWVFQLLCSVTNHSKLSGQTTILLCPGTLWVRKSDRPQQDGLSCFLIWEDLVSWVVDSKAELRWDHWPEDWHMASPRGFYFLLACGQVLRGNILRYQERIQVTAAWPLSPHFRGHLVSLSPFFIDQSSDKSGQIQEEVTWAPL